MGQSILVVDAFTQHPFSGNPAAVCVLAVERSERWMQQVAAEMNLSETAFLFRRADEFHLRWFTPKVEVDLCGHATLASAHVLWSEGHLPASQEARFATLSGSLIARRVGEQIELDFPALLPKSIPAPGGLEAALGTPVTSAFQAGPDILVELGSETAVRNLKPDFALLEKFGPRGVIVTSRSLSPDFDFISRFFAPGAGINEDPVTGSAHCSLGPYWSERLRKAELRAFQASARGGTIFVRMGGKRVYLLGHAITVLRGELEI